MSTANYFHENAKVRIGVDGKLSSVARRECYELAKLQKEMDVEAYGKKHGFNPNSPQEWVRFMQTVPIEKR